MLLIRLLIKLLGGIWKVKEKINTLKGTRRRIYSGLYNLYFESRSSFIGANAKFKGIPEFPHGIFSIFISSGAEIGTNCVIFQQVTIGSNWMPHSKKNGFPIIGDNCFIGAGAIIIGGIRIGNNCRIGASCIVTEDVPDNSVVVMDKARIITRSETLDNKYYSWARQGLVYLENGKMIKETDPSIIASFHSKK